MTEESEFYRLFVSLPVPEMVRREISTAQEELSRIVPKEGARWTPPAQFHLTLRFLGDVACNKVEALRAALQNACETVTAFTLRAEGIGCFPNLHRPRVIWAGLVDATGALERLWANIQTATGSFATETNEHKFTGHITIGRIKLIRPPEKVRLVTQLQPLASRGFGAWQADQVLLMRSELFQQGARHTNLAAFPLEMTAA